MNFDPIRMVQDGGPFVYAILAATSALQVAVVLLFGTLLARLRVPSMFWVAMGLLPLMIGFFGTIQATGMAMDAVSNASSEVLPTIAAAGTSVALYPAIAGAISTALTFTSFAIATGLGVMLRPGKEARFTFANAVVAILVLLIGTPLGFVFAGPIAGLMFFGAAVGLVFAGLRYPKEDPRDCARVANGRAATALYGVVALGCASLAALSIAWSSSYHAQAYASAEMRGALLADAFAGHSQQQGAIAGLSLFLLCALPFVVGPGMRALDRRGLITLVMGAIAFIPSLGLGLAAVWQLYGLTQLARPLGEVRAEALAELDLVVPGADGGLVTRELSGGHVLTFVGSKVLFDGEPADASRALSPTAEVLVEAPASLPLAELAVWVAPLRDGFCLGVRTPDLRCLRVVPAQGAPIETPAGDGIGIAARLPRTRVLRAEAGWNLHYENPVSGEHRTEVALETQDLRIAFGEIREQYDEDGVQVWFGEAARVSDYIAFFEAVSVRADSDDQDVLPWISWRTDAPEVLPEPTAEDIEINTSSDSPFEASAKKTVRTYESQIRYCYQRELAKRPDLAGEIDVQVSVGPDGSVLNARVARSTIANVTVESCVVSRFRRMQFDPPPSGKVEVVRLPYEFSGSVGTEPGEDPCSHSFWPRRRRPNSTSFARREPMPAASSRATGTSTPRTTTRTIFSTETPRRPGSREPRGVGSASGSRGR